MTSAPFLSIGHRTAEGGDLVLWTSAAERITPLATPTLALVHRTSDGGDLSIGQKHQSQTDMSLGQANRPWIQVRLSRPHPDVDDILAGWARQRKKAANIVAAIQLYEAVLQGDVEEVGRLMAAAGGKSSDVQDSLSLSYKESDSIKEIEEKREEAIPADIAALMQQLAITCCKDVKLNAADLHETADKLHEAGYAAEDVKRWTAEVWAVDYRGKRGSPPWLKNVINEIAKVRSLPPVSDENPYLQDAYFRDRDVDDPPTFAKPDPLPPRQIELLPEHHPRLSRWLMVDNHMQVAVNQPTYDTYLRPLKAIGFADSDTLVIEAPNEYVREWFQRHIEAAYVAQYNRVDRRDGQQKPSITFSVVIQGDDQYRGKEKSI